MIKKRISNYHSHVALCGHAEGLAYQYVEEAIKHGYQEIGISDHAPIPVEWFGEKIHHDLWLSKMMDYQTFLKDYLKQLDYCIDNYPEIKILKGLEIEYVPGYRDYYYQLLKHLDYFNLGIHYFVIDNKVTNSYKPLSKELLKGYAQTIEEALETELFSCLVHPDLFLFNIIEFDEFCEQISRRIIEAAIKNNVYLEINCNGKNKYPRLEFWKIVKQYNYSQIIIGSDAHKVKDFHGKQLHDTISFAEKLEIDIAPVMIPKKTSIN